RAALAQVAELAALLLHDDAICAEPVPDIGPALELLAVPGSALEGLQLAALGRALGAARLTAATLARIARDAPRTAALRVEPPPKEFEQRLTQSVDAEGTVLDAASRALARARQHVREARQRLVARLEALLGALDPTDRAPAWEMCIAFDDLCARARYAVEVNGFAPEIGGAPLAIRNGRHPLLVPSSPPFPLSVPERGDVTNSPSPEGRGGQGVRTDGAER